MLALLTCARRAEVRALLGDAPGKGLIVFLAAMAIGGATAARADEPLDQLLARAQRGDATAQAELGWRYARGEGLPQNHAEAVKWFRKAADQGNVAAQVNLGVSYAKGEGVSQDYAEAAKWYRKAADQGNAVAQSVLGAMYARGQGVTRDYMLAYMWFHLAAGALSGPDREAALRERELAASKLTAAQLTLAQQMARDWKPTPPEGK